MISCFFSFFPLLNYSPPRLLVGSQDTPQRTSSPSKSRRATPSLPKLLEVFEMGSICAANRALVVCSLVENLDFDKEELMPEQSMTR